MFRLIFVVLIFVLITYAVLEIWKAWKKNEPQRALEKAQREREAAELKLKAARLDNETFRLELDAIAPEPVFPSNDEPDEETNPAEELESQ